MRERGLKPPLICYDVCVLFVVPRAGTWIETSVSLAGIGRVWVVPRAGTWIETLSVNENTGALSVVPRAGTWIETVNDGLGVHSPSASFPVRERGLKHPDAAKENGSGGRSPCGNVD